VWLGALLFLNLLRLKSSDLVAVFKKPRQIAVLSIIKIVALPAGMHKLYVRCSGWSYDAWLEHFYPANLEGREFLKYYSQVFDFVEIDSSFYRTPNLFMTKRWAKITPDKFRFTAKFPRSITHEKRLAADSEKELRYFLDMMRLYKTADTRYNYHPL